MKKAAVLLSLVLFSGPLAGCLEGQEAPISYSSSAQCTVSWHVAFFDLSNDAFSEWGGEVTFYGSDGSTDTIREFSAEKQFVLLDPSLEWSMEYTFFEGDVGFMNGETMYGGDNAYGTHSFGRRVSDPSVAANAAAKVHGSHLGSATC